VLLDTGPLVALLNADDAAHAWAVQMSRQLPTPLATCEAVLSEAAFLLGRHPHGTASLLELLASGALTLDFRLAAELERVTTLMRKYARVPMSLADACLVRMSEQHPHCAVFTLDSDFKIYRRNGRQQIPLIAPD
jgi:predicted nucleic acid-binding protein